MRAALVAVAFVSFAVAGCSDDPTRPTQDRFVDSGAQIVAVTFPESTSSYGLVPVTIHWKTQNCTERLTAVTVDYVPGSQTLVTLRTRIRVDDFRCPQDGSECISRDTTIDIPVEPRILISGYGGAVDVSEFLYTGVQSRHHAIRVLQRGSGLPVSGVQLEHRSYADSGSPLWLATTDSTGWVIAAPACSENPDSTTYLVVDDPEFGCGVDLIPFHVGLAPCHNALRTLLLYGRMPPLPAARARSGS